MTRKRQLQIFKVMSPNGCPGLMPGDMFTIEGYFVPTRFERWKQGRYIRAIRGAIYDVKLYFSNLWAAICGRRDDH